MVNAAEASVQTLLIEEALALHGQDDVIFIDLRDIRELAKTGRVAGARHVPRGMLEFWIDPATSYHFSQSIRPLFFIVREGSDPPWLLR